VLETLIQPELKV